MKRLNLHFLIVFLFNLFCYSQTTVVDSVFEQELINLGIDTNGVTGDILDVDAQSVTVLNLSGATNITDITGINAFVNVTNLDLGNNQVAVVEPTALTSLLHFRTNANEVLSSLDLTQNTLLETFYLHGDFPNEPPITQIDLSQNVNLVSIDGDFLDFVTDFIFPTTSTSLTNISLRYLSDPLIDVSAFPNLEVFNIGGWRSNVDIVLPATNTLRDLRITSIEIPTIDLSVFTNLENLYLWGTYVQNLILPNSNAFTDIFVILHDIQNPLDFSVAPNLTDIDITSNRDTPLVVDLTQNPVLEDLDLSRNDMNSIDLTQNLLLETLRLNVNNFTNLDVTQNVLLDRFDAYSNQLPNVDLSQNTVLRYLNLNDNLIPNIDVTQNVELRSISINNNLLTTTGFALTHNIDLTSLDVSYNQIESLDITQNVELFSFDLSHNLFPGNDILNQFSTIVANQGRLRGRLIANNNLLEGPIPDFYGLYDPTIQTRRFELFINENRFHFGDFEAQHLGLVSLLTTMSIGPSPDVVMREYWYAPQARVNNIENFTVNAGDDITLTTTVRGEQNHYVWFKDGVVIPDAPDAPEYTITNVNSCDQAVYHSEIRSDLVPFENANPPGTGGKNLLLRRNNITLNVVSPAETCSSLVTPIAGSTNIPLNQTIEWTSNAGACGYILSIGTTSGGTDIFTGDVEDVTSYNIGTNLPPNTLVYVTITPYFASGNVLTCDNTADTFTTSAIESPIVCTALLPAYASATLPTYTNLEWSPADFAIGYFVTIGTTPSGNDIYDMLDVGNTTVFNPPSDFMPGETYYITITPYNGLGNATGCVNESFMTESMGLACTNLTSPSSGDMDVAIDAILNWNSVTGATGYTLNVGTSSGGTDIFSGDVGNVLTYDLPSSFPQNTEIFVTVVPYNATVTAINCTEESFTTVLLPPSCTTITSPANGATNIDINASFVWDAVANASGYTLNVGTTTGGAELFNGDIGNVTTYTLSNELPQITEIFVTVIPYNASGNASGCNEISFTTELLVPDCTTTLLSPAALTDVPITTNLQWDTTAYTDGYILTVGTTPGGNDIVDAEDVGNTNNYTFASNLPQGETIYVNIIPYNAIGNAINCAEYSFVTEILPVGCSSIISPAQSEINVALDAIITWSAAENANNYEVLIGTGLPGASNIFSGIVGNVTSLNLPNDLPSNEEILVQIQAFNDITGAQGCVNAFSFTTTEVIPDCTNLIVPIDGSTDISITTGLQWDAVTNATGYIVNVGTQPDGTDIVNAVDVGNVTTYNFPSDLPQNTEIFVSIHPYNSAGVNMFCVGPSFTTELLIPECATISLPMNGAIDVAVNTEISWNSVLYADGYILNIGTSTGVTDVVDNLDVGNSTSITLSEDLPSETTLYLTIIPYNSEGEAIGCNEIVFETEVIIPECTEMISPVNNVEDVSVTTSISWDMINNADGYVLSIETEDLDTIVDGVDVGNTTTFNPNTELPDNTVIFVNITPYNEAGNALDCFTFQFTTENRQIIIPKFFTPNNDSNHDYWRVEDPQNEIKRIYIFDRFGKLLKTLSPTSVGWDGQFNGTPLPNSDYWFQIERFAGVNITGHFTLKR
ncbi:T9SS type B sorting domain-containing protein [Winogradskyella jejuensis]|uniref:Gliding motility-associated C-terminal domain-containing protein n=1 Tax=Winogradskyella jejuensis TaxID=1089305 RepID=A0A1M5UDX6_9FLAO|nr:T9SS type B sorting domain-containing protein [Winogradskyella jejuensis]SHH61159.1 gliding motility-associated C-terminal domain-containing protein [Winogradskyella jejuensis]